MKGCKLGGMRIETTIATEQFHKNTMHTVTTIATHQFDKNKPRHRLVNCSQKKKLKRECSGEGRGPVAFDFFSYLTKI
jgi:hypothetical protein